MICRQMTIGLLIFRPRKITTTAFQAEETDTKTLEIPIKESYNKATEIQTTKKNTKTKRK
jgi:hypothetical protein